MKEIRGDAKTIRQLLSGAKYTIDYYQRVLTSIFHGHLVVIVKSRTLRADLAC